MLRTIRRIAPQAQGRFTNSFSSTSSSRSRDGETKKIALVLGSSGALGSTVAKYLSRELGMSVLGADVAEMPKEFNQSDWELDGFICLPDRNDRPSSVADVTAELALGVYDILGDTDEIDTLVVASGAWAGDNRPMITDKSLSAQEIRQDAMEYGSNVDHMIFANLVPVIAAGYTAQRFVGPNGLFVTIGATAALSSTPGMLGYGLSKAAAHHMVRTMGATTGKSLESTSKQKAGRRYRQFAANLDTLSVIGILPATIDTPSNRKFNPNADFTMWTKPIHIAKEIGRWVEMPHLRPHSGALVKVSTTEQGSIFDLVR